VLALRLRRGKLNAYVREDRVPDAKRGGASGHDAEEAIRYLWNQPENLTLIACRPRKALVHHRASERRRMRQLDRSVSSYFNSSVVIRTISVCMFGTGLAALGGCDSQVETSHSKTATLAQSAIAIAEKRWLDANDPTLPELWLASREAKADLPTSAPQVKAFRDLIARAGRRYVETPRMIANRAVQLEEMLAARGIEENARLAIEGLIDIREDNGDRRSFGEAVQHYFNIRQIAPSREQALRSLREAESENRH
jgi:hypothetical protein